MVGALADIEVSRPSGQFSAEGAFGQLTEEERSGARKVLTSLVRVAYSESGEDALAPVAVTDLPSSVPTELLGRLESVGLVKVGTEVKAKDDSNTWLIGANFASKMRIEVRVPLWVKNNTIYPYNIIFDDGTCIDPRVHVER